MYKQANNSNTLETVQNSGNMSENVYGSPWKYMATPF